MPPRDLGVMALNRESYMDMPEELIRLLSTIPIGGRKRLKHDCGAGEPLVLFHTPPRSSAYCHRCGYLCHHEVSLSLDEKLALARRQAESDRQVATKASLPEVTSRDPSEWPVELSNWLYGYGLGPAHISVLGAYYSQSIDRLVLPVKVGNEVVSWTARHTSRTPKWLLPMTRRDGLVAKYGLGKGTKIALCEDILSAYKVSLVTEAWALMGTKISDRALVDLTKDPRPVALWLDNDVGRRNGYNPGQLAASKIASRLRSLGKVVTNITSPMDPKGHTVSFIKDKLNENP